MEEFLLSKCDAADNSWESLGQQGDQMSQSSRKSTLSIHWKDCFWSWSSNTLATCFEEPTHWKRPWCWERLRAGGEGSSRGWEGWMASLTQWIWIWANSRRWWRTGKPGVLQFMGLQRVGHYWVTEQQQQPQGKKNFWHKKALFPDKQRHLLKFSHTKVKVLFSLCYTK